MGVTKEKKHQKPQTDFANYHGSLKKSSNTKALQIWYC